MQAIPDAARAGPHLRLLSANVRFTNPTPERLARELLAADADVVLLQEVTHGGSRCSTRPGSTAATPTGSTVLLDPGGLAVYSRLPLTGVADHRPAVLADHPGEHRVPRHPRHGRRRARRRVRRRACAATTRGRQPDRPHPLPAAAADRRRRLQRQSVQPDDASDDGPRARQRARTARTRAGGHVAERQEAVPPMRLDHVFVDDAIVVLDIRELGVGLGSQARAHRARVRLSQTSASRMTTKAEVAANTSTAGRIQPRSRRSWNRRPAYDPRRRAGRGRSRARPDPSSPDGRSEGGDRQERPEEERRGEGRAHLRAGMVLVEQRVGGPPMPAAVPVTPDATPAATSVPGVTGSAGRRRSRARRAGRTYRSGAAASRP